MVEGHHVATRPDELATGHGILVVQLPPRAGILATRMNGIHPAGEVRPGRWVRPHAFPTFGLLRSPRPFEPEGDGMAGSLDTGGTACLIGITAALTLYVAAGLLAGRRLPAGCYLRYVWFFLCCFAITELLGFSVAIWMLALLCFWALREYFSLVDIRLQDRLGLLGGYLSIPFMIYFIRIDWYGMFIVSIPVYAFLAIPLLVTLGGREREGTVFSVGAIDFGLFLFVYCLGHIGYLLLYSAWMAAMLILAVALSDAVAFVVSRRTERAAVRHAVSVLSALPLTVGLNLLVSGWTDIPVGHAVALGLLIPALAAMGRHTIDYVKYDLGIRSADPLPGRGEILDHLRSLFFVAPVVFHYIRYYLK